MVASAAATAACAAGGPPSPISSGEPLGEPLGSAPCERLPVGDTLTDTVAAAARCAVAVPDAVPLLAIAATDADAPKERLRVGVALLELDAVPVREALPVAEVEVVPVHELVAAGLPLPVPVTDAGAPGDSELVAVAEPVALSDGAGVPVGGSLGMRVYEPAGEPEEMPVRKPEEDAVSLPVVVDEGAAPRGRDVVGVAVSEAVTEAVVVRDGVAATDEERLPEGDAAPVTLGDPPAGDALPAIVPPMLVEEGVADASRASVEEEVAVGDAAADDEPLLLSAALGKGAAELLLVAAEEGVPVTVAVALGEATPRLVPVTEAVTEAVTVLVPVALGEAPRVVPAPVAVAVVLGVPVTSPEGDPGTDAVGVPAKVVEGGTVAAVGVPVTAAAVGENAANDAVDDAVADTASDAVADAVADAVGATVAAGGDGVTMGVPVTAAELVAVGLKPPAVSAPEGVAVEAPGKLEGVGLRLVATNGPSEAPRSSKPDSALSVARAAHAMVTTSSAQRASGVVT